MKPIILALEMFYVIKKSSISMTSEEEKEAAADPSLQTGAALANMNADKQEVLLNLLYAPPNSVLADLATLLMRLENL